MASPLVIWEVRYGARTSRLMFCQTGDMMKKVMNNERPMTIWLAGADWS